MKDKTQVLKNRLGIVGLLLVFLIISIFCYTVSAININTIKTEQYIEKQPEQQNIFPLISLNNATEFLFCINKTDITTFKLNTIGTTKIEFEGYKYTFTKEKIKLNVTIEV